VCREEKFEGYPELVISAIVGVVMTLLEDSDGGLLKICGACEGFNVKSSSIVRLHQLLRNVYSVRLFRRSKNPSQHEYCNHQ